MKTLKTTSISIRSHGGPDFVLCPGHVDAKTFNKAFKAEGWSTEGDYSQDELSYTYMTKKKLTGKNRFAYNQVSPNKAGAKPYTSTTWDHK